MPLKFPTMAQACYDAWLAAPRTISLAVIACRHGATCERTTDFDGVLWTYSFDDDTSLSVRGKGKSHKVEVQLP